MGPVTSKNYRILAGAGRNNPPDLNLGGAGPQPFLSAFLPGKGSAAVRFDIIARFYLLERVCSNFLWFSVF